MRFFSLYPSSDFTIGDKDSCLVDIERSLFVVLPKTMGSFFSSHKQFDIDELLFEFDDDEKDTIEEYILYLCKNRFGFITTFAPSFEYYNFDKQFDNPFLFQSLILDISSLNQIFFLRQTLKPELFRFMQIRLLCKINFENLLEMGKFIRYCAPTACELLVDNENFSCLSSECECFLDNFKEIVTRIVVVCSTSNKCLHKETEKIIIVHAVLNENFCPLSNIYKKQFMINIDCFHIAHIGNMCLYKKIYINSDGNIKNCPRSNNILGNIKSDLIEDLYNGKEYKDLSEMSKDKILKCKGCSKRYICIDCVFLNNTQGCSEN